MHDPGSTAAIRPPRLTRRRLRRRDYGIRGDMTDGSRTGGGFRPADKPILPMLDRGDVIPRLSYLCWEDTKLFEVVTSLLDDRD
jgi:hypothetical protein